MPLLQGPPDNGTSLGAGIAAVAATDVIRGDPALLVGRSGQGNYSILTGDKVLYLHGIANGIDVSASGSVITSPI